MQFAKGQIGAIIIIIAIVGTVFGGFMLNVNNVYGCTTNYKYITDVAGAFSGTSADMEVDYNPLANVTGYSVYDPIQGGGALDLVHGINYISTKASESSGYWIQTITGDATEYNVTLFSETNSTSAQMYYGDKTATIQQVEYAGHFYESTLPMVMSQYSNLEVAGRTVVGINLISVYDYLTALKQCGVDVGNISKLNFTTGSSTDGYPGFMGHVSYRDELHPGIIPVKDYIFTAGTYSSYIIIHPNIDPATGELSQTTCDINGETLGAGDVYIAWGIRDIIKTLDLNGSSGGEITNDYIDPSQGVQPVTEHVTRTAMVQEDVYGTKYSWGAQFNFTNMNIAEGTIDYTYYDETGAEHTETWARWTVTKPARNPDVWDVQVIIFPGTILLGTIDVSSVEYKGGIVLEPGFSVDLSTGEWSSFGIMTSEGSDDTWLGPYCELIPSGKTYISPPKGAVAKMTSTLPTSQKGHGSYPLQDATCSIDGQARSTSSNDQTFTVETHMMIYHTKTVTYDTDVSYWYNGYDVASATLIVPKTLFDGSSPLGKDVFRIFWNTADRGYLYSDVTIELKSDGWYVNGIQIGNWPAVSVKIYRDLAGSPYLGVVPVMTFNNFMDYKTMDISEIPIGLSVVDGDGNTVDDYTLTSFKMLKWDCNQATHRHEVVDTVLFLPSGGLYTQDGVFNQAQSFPGDLMVKLRIMSAVHVGEGMTITNSAGESVYIPTDHISKWISPVDGKTTCDFADLSVFYLDKNIPSVSIDGKTYTGGMYYTNSDGASVKLDPGYLYYQFGTKGDIVRVGTSESTNDWSVTLNGVWAMSTSYSTGENVAEAHMEWNGLGGVWGWTSIDTVLMFSGISMALLVLCAWRFELTGLDWVLGLCAVLFPVIAWL